MSSEWFPGRFKVGLGMVPNGMFWADSLNVTTSGCVKIQGSSRILPLNILCFVVNTTFVMI